SGESEHRRGGVRFEPWHQLGELRKAYYTLLFNALRYLWRANLRIQVKGYEATARRLKNASMRLVNEGPKYSVLERDRAVQTLVLSEGAIIHAHEISKKGKATIASLKKANAELSKIIKDDTYSTGDIKEYAKQLQELVNMYQVLTK
ncbi:MAG: hypothetical protein Q8M09_20015, partial [Pseudomonadota bacterium]|nr:hypothetical protein [Pseudomonadota bacterium]MDP1906502.1 hypothetical protein [Pseudomonadota bacterium]